MEEKILQVFLYHHELKFSEIEKQVNIRSNKLAYHIKRLEKKGILVKEKEFYKLSDTAEHLIPYLSKKKHVLSVNEKQGLKQERQEIEASLREMDSEKFGEGTKHQVDRGKLRAEASRLEVAIREGEAGSLRGTSKDKVHKRVKELEDVIREGMLSKKDMNDPGNALCHLNWEKRNAQAISEWKQSQRRLEPNNPNASNVEQLRRRK